MKLNLVVPLFLIALGTIVATGAVPVDGPADELDGGIYFTPADTPNGDQYAEINDDGQLAVEIEVVPGTETHIDDVFTVSFAGVEGNDSSASVWIEPDDSARVSYYRMDDDEPIEGEDNAIQLDPGESVNIGFVVDTDADIQASFTETSTYQASIRTSDDNGGSVGTGSGGTSSGDTSTGASDNTDTGSSGDTETEPSDGTETSTSEDDTTDPPSPETAEEVNDGPDGTTVEVGGVSPEVTLGGFFLRTLMLLVMFVTSGAGLARMIRNRVDQTES